MLNARPKCWLVPLCENLTAKDIKRLQDELKSKSEKRVKRLEDELKSKLEKRSKDVQIKEEITIDEHPSDERSVDDPVKLDEDYYILHGALDSQTSDHKRKEYQCYKCDMTFFKSDILVLHIRSHSERRACKIVQSGILPFGRRLHNLNLLEPSPQTTSDLLSTHSKQTEDVITDFVTNSEHPSHSGEYSSENIMTQSPDIMIVSAWTVRDPSDLTVGMTNKQAEEIEKQTNFNLNESSDPVHNDHSASQLIENKLFTCDYCDKVFPQRNHVKLHERAHTRGNKNNLAVASVHTTASLHNGKGKCSAESTNIVAVMTTRIEETAKQSSNESAEIDMNETRESTRSKSSVRRSANGEDFVRIMKSQIAETAERCYQENEKQNTHLSTNLKESALNKQTANSLPEDKNITGNMMLCPKESAQNCYRKSTSKSLNLAINSSVNFRGLAMSKQTAKGSTEDANLTADMTSGSEETAQKCFQESANARVNHTTNSSTSSRESTLDKQIAESSIEGIDLVGIVKSCSEDPTACKISSSINGGKKRNKPFPCLICGKGYSQLNYLKLHERAHTGGNKNNLAVASVHTTESLHNGKGKCSAESTNIVAVMTTCIEETAKKSSNESAEIDMNETRESTESKSSVRRSANGEDFVRIMKSQIAETAEKCYHENEKQKTHLNTNPKESALNKQTANSLPEDKNITENMMLCPNESAQNCYRKSTRKSLNRAINSSVNFRGVATVEESSEKEQNAASVKIHPKEATDKFYCESGNNSNDEQYHSATDLGVSTSQKQNEKLSTTIDNIGTKVYKSSKCTPYLSNRSGVFKSMNQNVRRITQAKMILAMIKVRSEKSAPKSHHESASISSYKSVQDGTGTDLGTTCAESQQNELITECSNKDGAHTVKMSEEIALPCRNAGNLLIPCVESLLEGGHSSEGKCLSINMSESRKIPDDDDNYEVDIFCESTKNCTTAESLKNGSFNTIMSQPEVQLQDSEPSRKKPIVLGIQSEKSHPKETIKERSNRIEDTTTSKTTCSEKRNLVSNDHVRNTGQKTTNLSIIHSENCVENKSSCSKEEGCVIYTSEIVSCGDDGNVFLDLSLPTLKLSQQEKTDVKLSKAEKHVSFSEVKGVVIYETSNISCQNSVNLSTDFSLPSSQPLQKGNTEIRSKIDGAHNENKKPCSEGKALESYKSANVSCQNSVNLFNDLIFSSSEPLQNEKTERKSGKDGNRAEDKTCTEEGEKEAPKSSESINNLCRSGDNHFKIHSVESQQSKGENVIENEDISHNSYHGNESNSVHKNCTLHLKSNVKSYSSSKNENENITHTEDIICKSSSSSCHTNSTSHLKLKNKMKYKCQTCKKHFSLRRNYRRHKRSRCGQGLYKCPHCAITFPLRILLGFHLAKHSKERKVRCLSAHSGTRVHKSSNFQTQVASHNIKLNRKRSNDSVITSAELGIHSIEFPKNKMKVKIPKSSCSSSNLDTQEASHINELQKKQPNQDVNLPPDLGIQCTDLLVSEDRNITANVTTQPESAAQMDDHRNESISSHTSNGKKVHKCEYCGRSFSQRRYLNMHRSMHTGIGLHQCAHCDKKFLSRNSLSCHLASHSPEKPFACDKCDRRFRLRHYLLRHSVVHNRAKPFQCLKCDKSYGKRNSLRIHMTVHMRERLNKCSHCNAAFFQKCHLERHLLIHSGKKPFTCHVCRVSFSTKFSCRRHMKVHIGKNHIAPADVNDFIEDVIKREQSSTSAAEDGKLCTDGTITSETEVVASYCKNRSNSKYNPATNVTTLFKKVTDESYQKNRSTDLNVTAPQKKKARSSTKLKKVFTNEHSETVDKAAYHKSRRKSSLMRSKYVADWDMDSLLLSKEERQRKLAIEAKRFLAFLKSDATELALKSDFESVDNNTDLDTHYAESWRNKQITQNFSKDGNLRESKTSSSEKIELKSNKISRSSCLNIGNISVLPSGKSLHSEESSSKSLVTKTTPLHGIKYATNISDNIVNCATTEPSEHEQNCEGFGINTIPPRVKTEAGKTSSKSENPSLKKTSYAEKREPQGYKISCDSRGDSVKYTSDFKRLCAESPHGENIRKHSSKGENFALNTYTYSERSNANRCDSSFKSVKHTANLRSFSEGTPENKQGARISTKGVIKLSRNPAHKSHYRRKESTYVRKKTSPRGIKYPCKHCGKCFAQRSYRAKHENTHTGEDLLDCPHCDKRFHIKSSLRYHLASHAVVKPHKCEVCGKCFNLRHALLRHEATHLGLKPYQCLTCRKYFATSSSLRNHKITHTNTRPFACSMCPATFNHRVNLLKHTLRHTGEKPFQCNVCLATFSTIFSRRRHMKTHVGKNHIPRDESKT